jgi:hypothetical protein
MPNPETTESVLNAWMVLARQNKNLHREYSVHYKSAAEASMVTALVVDAWN